MTFPLTLTSATFDTTTEKFGSAAMNGGTGTTTAPVITALPYTMEAWVKHSATPTAVEVACGQLHVAWLGINTSGNAQCNLGTSPTPVNLVSTININDGNWHHLAVTVSAGNVATFYVDGVVGATSSTAASVLYDSNFQIRIYSTGSQWNGDLDEVALFNYVKYTGAFTPPSAAYTGTETGLMALYHLDSSGTDSTGAVAANAYTVTGPTSGTIGNANTYSVTANGTLVSPVTVTISQNGTTGTLSSSTVTLPSGSPVPQSFTLTPTAAGTDTLGFTNGGSLTNPSNVAVVTTVATTILPSNSAIYYSPYNWFVSGSLAKTISGGAYFKTLFSGSSCTLNFALQTAPYPYIKVLIDGQPVYSGVVSANMSLTMPSVSASWPHHFLQVFVMGISGTPDRWNTQAAALVLSSITLGSGATVSLPGVAPRTLLIYGDSITEAEWVTAPVPRGTPNPDVSTYEGTLGWAFLQGQLLGAEVGVVGFGRQGFVETGVGNVPAFGSTFNYLWAGQARTFSPMPDLVVVNQGTNDNSGIGITGSQTQTAAQAAFNAMLGVITCPIVVMRPFNGNNWSYIQAALAAIGSSQITQMDTTGFFNTTDSSDGLHPLAVANLGSIGPKVAAALKPLLSPAGRSYSFSAVAGGSAPGTAGRPIGLLLSLTHAS